MSRDHRNKPVSLLRSSWVLFWRSIGRGERAQRWKRVDKALSRAAPARNYWMFGSLAGGYLASWVAIVVFHHATGTDVGRAMIYVMVGSGSAGHFAACILFPFLYQSGRPFISCCLAEGICPVCEYELAGLDIDPDGCVHCPECGSHWRRVTRA